MIVYNAIRCSDCSEVIESVHRHDFRTCRCGKVSVDGGLEYLRRCGDDYCDLSVDSEQPFHIVRKFAYRTGHGKPGDSDYGTFRKTLLCDMTDEHLQCALDYVRDKFGICGHWMLLLKEKLYRNEQV